MKNTLLFFSTFLFLYSCAFTQKIKTGKAAYERKQFAVAIPMLKKEYNKSKSRIEKGKLAMMLGDSYTRTNQSKAAIPWYLSAYDYQFGEEALKAYAYALKRNQQYGEAKKAFKELGIEIGSPYEYRREIQACELAIDWAGKNKSQEYTVSTTSFNSPAADYAPTLTPDQQLVFTSDRSDATGTDPYNWTGNAFSDIFTVNLQSNEITSFSPLINTIHNEGTAVFNPDFTEIYFSRCYSNEKRGDNYCKLMKSTKEEDGWSVAQPLSFVEEKVNYGHPAFSADGQTLYFSSDHPDGWGGYDIYYSTNSLEGWTLPKLLSRGINTQGDEKFPTIHNDTLYFSSDYHAGMGGLDIFRTYKMKNDRWSPVHNLRAPINSSEDDFGLIVNTYANNPNDVLQSGFFSSTRKDGTGWDDIYKYEKRLAPPPPPAPDTVEVTEPEPIVYKLLLDVYVLEKIYKIESDPNSKVLGRRPLNGAKLDAMFGKEKNAYTVGPEGLIQIELKENTDYRFFASQSGYLNNTGKFSTKGIGQDPNNPTQKFELEIELDKIFKNREITLENIYYDFDDWAIRTDAEPTLNQLATTLSQNPGIRIELASHTDCQGNNSYNEKLSQKRAQSAVDYLITIGIPAERLAARGYGENAPAIQCACQRCTDDEHQANRRTTFKVID